MRWKSFLGALTKKREMGLLEWSISLLPQAKQELHYQFVVEHPPELTVMGLNI
jgi:hypothetical protein